MGLFNNLFGSESQPSASNINWKILTNLSQLQNVISESAQKPVLIFKHSTRCGISRMTLKRFENDYGLEDKVTLYFLDLLQYRDISNEISQLFNIVHQSPQLLLIKDGKSVYDASHDRIEASDLENHL